MVSGGSQESAVHLGHMLLACLLKLHGKSGADYFLNLNVLVGMAR